MMQDLGLKCCFVLEAFLEDNVGTVYAQACIQE